jgi:hypothetical protein
MSALLLANWQAIAGFAAMLFGALGLYLKGRGDAKAKAQLEDITHANSIRKAGADARASADVAPGRLHDDDGFKRD